MSEFTHVDRQLILDAIDADHAIACLHDVCLVVWRGPVTVASIRNLADTLRAATRTRPEGMVVLGTVEPGVPLAMSREARVWLAALLHEQASRLREVGILVEEEGIDRWLRRGLLSSIALTAHGPVQELTERNAAAAWASERSGSDEVTEARVLAAIEQLDRRVVECREPGRREAAHSTMTLPTR